MADVPRHRHRASPATLQLLGVGQGCGQYGGTLGKLWHLPVHIVPSPIPCSCLTVPSFHSLHLHQHHGTGSQHPPLLIHTPQGQTPASSCHRGTFLSPVPSMDLPEQAMTAGVQQLLLSHSPQIPGVFGQCHDGEGRREGRLFTFALPVQEAS